MEEISDFGEFFASGRSASLTKNANAVSNQLNASYLFVYFLNCFGAINLGVANKKCLMKDSRKNVSH